MQWGATRDGLPGLVAEALEKGVADVGWDEGGDVAAEPCDFLHEPRAEERVGVLGHEEEGLDGLVELAVHQGELELELEVGDGAEAADDGAATASGDVVHEESLEAIDLDAMDAGAGEGGGEEVHAFLGGEEGGFGGVVGDGDDDAVEELGGALDDIEVPVGEGIEASGVDGGAHVQGVSRDAIGKEGWGSVRGASPRSFSVQGGRGCGGVDWCAPLEKDPGAGDSR